MRHGYPPVWLSAALLALALMWRMVGAPLTATQFEDMQTPLWQARVLLPTRVGRILRLWMPGAQEAQAQTIREEALGEEGQVLDRLMNGEDQQTISVYLAQEGRVVEMALESYVCGVVAAEMPAGFEQQALNAQAAAARTYTVYQMLHHTAAHTADLCDDVGCCQAWISREERAEKWAGEDADALSAKITQAVVDTDGMVVCYEGAPIQALFHAASAAFTRSAAEVFGEELPYLQSVESPEGEEVPNYHSQVVLTAEEVRTAALAQYPGADLSGDPSGWFSQPVENSAGGVASVDLGGVTLTGSEVRTLFGLRSASFSVSWDGEAFTFDVTGYGHGVGMSQYGANAMAREGSDFEEILTWYYTGTEVGELYGAAGE